MPDGIRRTKKRFDYKFLAAGVLTLAGIVILLNLGAWQMERLAWKEGLLARLEEQKHVDAGTVPLGLMIDNPNNSFMRGSLVGLWMPGKNVRVGPRAQDGRWGYWLVTPFMLNDGRVVLVNRGWVDETMIAVMMESAPPIGISVITGTLRLPDEGRKSTAGDPRWWHDIDVAGIADALPLQNAAPLVMFLEKASPPDETAVKPAPVVASLRNEHRNYAIFWFGMAGVLAVVFYVAGLHPRVVSLLRKRSASSQGPSAP